MYMDTTVDSSGVNEVAVEIDGQGVGLFSPGRLVEVLEEPH
jgi:hypothetical protein